MLVFSIYGVANIFSDRHILSEPSLCLKKAL